MMKIIIEVDDCRFNDIIRLIVREELEKKGLLRFIRDEVKRVYISEKRGKSYNNLSKKIADNTRRIIILKKKLKKN